MTSRERKKEVARGSSIFRETETSHWEEMGTRVETMENPENQVPAAVDHLEEVILQDCSALREVGARHGVTEY